MTSRANLIQTVGLVTNQNELDVPQGALKRAINVNINERGVITPRRGFNDYGNATNISGLTAIKQVMEYRDRIFRHFDDKIQFEDQLGNFSDVTGSFTEVREGYRIKYETSKGNLYFTTEEGIKKIGVRNNSALTTGANIVAENSGVPRASYIEGISVDQVGGFLPAQSKNAYRFLFGKRDNNNNLLLGTASSREVVTNTNARVVVFSEQEITFANAPANAIANGDYIILNTKEVSYTLFFDTNGSATAPFNSSTLGTQFIKVDVQGSTENSAVAAAIFANTVAINIPEFDTPSLAGSVITLVSKEEGAIPVAISSTPARFTVLSTVTGSVTEGSPAVVELELIIPSVLDTTYFLQVYRSNIITAAQGLTLDDIDPGDELNIVFETPVTQEMITNGIYTFTDTTPESFRASGLPLYSNEITGEGILQSNDVPPVALDIDLFRGSLFYGNTKQAHRTNFDIVSVNDFKNNLTRIVISNEDITRFYTAASLEDVNTPEGGDFALSVSPSPSLQIDQTSRSLVKVINRDSLSPVNAFYLTGENDLPGKILLESKSLLDKPVYVSIESGYEAYDNTVVYSPGAKVSFNGLDYENILATTAPGDSSEDPSGNTTNNPNWAYFNISEEFSPQLPKTRPVERIAGQTTTTLIELTNHGFSNGNIVYFAFRSDGDVDAPDSFSGEFIVSAVTTNSFVIDYPLGVNFDSTGVNPFLTDLSAVFLPTLVSDNLVAPNRLYFSKVEEPEAVPFANFIDVGSRDREIKRILALRDNLFVFKDDGIFIVSGTSAPNFSVRRLDNARIIAADSAVVLNNQIYCLTDQGITTVTDSGAGIISRGIENLIIDVTSKIPNFDINTFGVAYENDRAYILFLPSSVTDDSSTIAYRYHIFERTWTQWQYPATCGIVMNRDSTLYIGDGARSFISKERKNLDYNDYADRNFPVSFIQSQNGANKFTISSLQDVKPFDVVLQIQDVTINYLNSRLLQRIDTFDTGLTKPFGSTFLEEFGASFGDNIASNFQLLNNYLVTLDPATITPKSISLVNIKEQVELLIDELNDPLAITTIKDYKKPITVTYETYITEIDALDNSIIVKDERPFLQQNMTIFKGYKKVIEYQPQHFGDPSAVKQIREATLIFDQNNFNDALMRFASDIEQAFTSVAFTGKGKGYWGDMPWGDPNHYWGGDGNDIPFRTIVPRGKQKCRYLTVALEHQNAREGFRLIGISAVVRAISSRGYR